MAARWLVPTAGTSDPALYGATSAVNSPNTAGWSIELDYMPFSHGGPDFWAWLNMKIGAQYIRYWKFDGAQPITTGAGTQRARQQHPAPLRIGSHFEQRRRHA